MSWNLRYASESGFPHEKAYICTGKGCKTCKLYQKHIEDNKDETGKVIDQEKHDSINNMYKAHTFVRKQVAE